MVVGNLFTPNSLAGEYHQPRSKLIGEDALVSIGTALLGGLFGSSSNSANNATQLQIARENNAFNERMFDRQIAYNWDMFNAENKYNSASEQVKRYLLAGINPALAMENQSAATAQGGSVSPPSASSMPVTHAYDPSPVFSRVSEILYNDAMREKELRLAEANARSKELENDFNSQYYDVELRRFRHQAMRDYTLGLITHQEYREMMESYDTRKELLGEDLKQKRGQSDFMQQQLAMVELERQLKDFDLQHAPDRFKAEMSLLGAQASAAIASGQLSIAQARKAYQDAAESVARTYGIKVNNEILDKTFDSTVKATNQSNWASYRSDRLSAQSDMMLFDELFGDEDRRNTIGRTYVLGQGLGKSIPKIGLKIGNTNISNSRYKLNSDNFYR